MGGRSKREGIYVYIELIHIAVQQKLTQHCKAIYSNLKKGSNKGKVTSYVQMNFHEAINRILSRKSAEQKGVA